ncbi:MAG: FixH family protein [Gammaproteobacteria bacterium]|nr:FixH family protein [Gammaproteobacteria bacterium]
MTNKISQDNPRAWRNPWVIGWVTLVAVVLLVNIVMISLAITTNPGLVSEDYYERGRNYEKTVTTKIAARHALAWSISADFPTSPVMNNNEKYRFTVVDKQGVPVSNGQVTASIYRPSDVNADFKVEMSEIVPGVYSGDINFPLKGRWEITVALKRGDDVYDFTRRVNVVTE